MERATEGPPLARHCTLVLCFPGHRKQLPLRHGEFLHHPHGQSPALACEEGPGRRNGPGGAGRAWKALEVVINGGQSGARADGEWKVLRLPKWKVPVNSTRDAS